MNIKEILESKQHNQHYLNRYISYIQISMLKNVGLSKDVYTEKHHICPKADDLFPEYTDLKINTWNVVVLTPEQHIFAHILLWKLYGGSQTQAIDFIFSTKELNKNHQRKIPSKIMIRYEANARREAVKYTASLKRGKKMYNNGVGEQFSKDCPGTDWVLGRLPRSEEWESTRTDAVRDKVVGASHYTDGSRNYFIKPGDSIPNNLTKGMKFRESTTYFYVNGKSIMQFKGKHTPPEGYETIKEREALSIIRQNEYEAITIDSIEEAKKLITSCMLPTGTINANKVPVYKRHTPKFRELLGIESHITDKTTIHCLINDIVPMTCGTCGTQVDFVDNEWRQYCNKDCWTKAKTGKLMQKTLDKQK